MASVETLLAQVVTLNELQELIYGIINALNPLIALGFFILIFGYLFFFFRMMFKLFVIAKIMWNLIYDRWLVYNKYDLRLPEYQNIRLNFNYSNKGLKELISLIKDTTTIF